MPSISVNVFCVPLFSKSALSFIVLFLVSFLFHRQNRLIAYRLLAMWSNHYIPLGKGVRIALPSCCVNAIRNRFPEDDPGAYVGFKEVTDAMEMGWSWHTVQYMNESMNLWSDFSFISVLTSCDCYNVKVFFFGKYSRANKRRLFVSMQYTTFSHSVLCSNVSSVRELLDIEIHWLHLIWSSSNRWVDIFTVAPWLKLQNELPASIHLCSDPFLANLKVVRSRMWQEAEITLRKARRTSLLL